MAGHPGGTESTGGRGSLVPPVLPRDGAPATPGHPSTPPDRGFWIAERVEDLAASLIQITGEEARESGLVFRGVPRPEAADEFDRSELEARRRGFELSLLDEPEGKAAVVALPASEPRLTPPLSVWHPVLLLATFLTTTWAGALHQGVDLLAQPGQWRVGVPYALALLAILGVHEMGHYLVARRRGVHVTLPYFIPAPFFLGTFGAFIRMEGRVRDRAAYFDVAVAGPLAGLAVAVGALYAGLAWSEPVMGHGLEPRSSVLVYVVSRLAGIAGTGPVELGAVAFAGWLGLMVTALNLVPVGQLDGGHVAYAVLGRRAGATLGAATLGLLITGGLLVSHHLLVWGLIAWMIAGTHHPPAQNELAPLGAGRHLLAGVTLLLLLSILLPWPT